MAASRSTTAKDLGPMPKVGGEIQKPLRKLETAKKPAMVMNPVISKETASLLSAALAQFAGKQIPEPPLDDLRAMRRAKEKATKEKEVVKVTTKPPSPQPEVVETEEKIPHKSNRKRPTGMSKKKKWRQLKKAQANPPVVRVQPEAHLVDSNRMEELRVKHAALLSKYNRKPMEPYVQPTFSRTFDVVPVVKEEAPAHEDEGEVTVVKWARKHVVHVPAGCALRKKVEVIFEEVAVSQAQLAWYELNTPITNSMGQTMMTDLLYHTKQGEFLTPFVLRMVKEPEPVCIGNVQVGVRFVTKQVMVPKEFGENACTRVASARRTQSQRSERGRILHGYPRNPGGPVGLSLVKPAPIIKMDAANDSSFESDDTPWNDDDLPPTAATGDHGFMDEVMRRRRIRQKYAQSKHSVYSSRFPYRPLAKLKLAEQAVPGIVAETAAVRGIDWELRKLRGSRIRRQALASFRDPNFSWQRCIEEAKCNGLGHVVGDIVSPTDTCLEEHRSDELSKQPVVEAVTHNPNPLSNIPWGSLSEDARKKFVAFKQAAMYPDLGNVRIKSFRYVSQYKFSEETMRGWFRMFTLDQRRMGRERLDAKRYNRWLKDNASIGWSSYDDGLFDRHPKHLVNDDASLQDFLSACERDNPSLLYWDSCDDCQAHARNMQLSNVYSLRKRRQLTVKERNILAGEIEERGEQAKVEAENTVVTGEKLESALSTSNLEGMNNKEKEVYLKTITRSDVSPDDLKEAIRHSWNVLKSADLGMASLMFKNWVSKDGGIILPPHMS